MTFKKLFLTDGNMISESSLNSGLICQGGDVRDHSETVVAYCGAYEKYKHLFLAAPELLEALKWQADYCARQAAANSDEALLWLDAERRARVAIAKATTREGGVMNLVNIYGTDELTACELDAMENSPQRKAAIAKARLQIEKNRLFAALDSIASMKVDENTDHAQLSSLCISIARTAVEESIKRFFDRAEAV